MSDDGTRTDAAPSGPLPKQLGPRRRWWFLALWVGCILVILVAQKLTAYSFESGHWSPSGPTEPTTIEVLWYWLLLCLIVLVAIVFFVGLRWWVPEKGTRGMIRVCGILPTFVGLIISYGISLWYRFLVFYMD